MTRETSCDQHANYMAGCPDCKIQNKAYRDKNNARIRTQQNTRHKRLGHIIRAQRRKRYVVNPSVKEKMLDWRKQNPERWKELQRLSYYRHHISRKQRMRNHNRQLKLEALSHYANGFMGCTCCKTTHIEFLTLDHVDDDGYIHRRILFGKNIGVAGQAFYLKLKQLGYPSKPVLQILCFNCQTMKLAREPCNH